MFMFGQMAITRQRNSCQEQSLMALATVLDFLVFRQPAPGHTRFEGQRMCLQMRLLCCVILFRILRNSQIGT